MPNSRFFSLSAGATILLVAGALASACSEPPAAAPPPPPQVTIETPQTRDVTNFAEFTGQTAAIESVEIRARVVGELQRMEFEPTSLVRQGQLLFVIEPEPYMAARDAAVANIRQWESELARAQSDLSRMEQAIQTAAVSEQEVDGARAAVQSAEANLAAAQAGLQQAEIDLSYTEVRSPINGLISRNLVDIGNLVGAAEPTLLATVMNVQPMFAYFDVPERMLLEILEEYDVELGQNTRGSAPVFLGVATDAGFPHEGVIDSMDNTVDSGTGTVQLRGIFPNDSRQLFPGLFSRLRIPVGEITGAVLVREEAIGTDLGGKYVLVVDGDNVVELRHVELGALQDDGMRVVVDGLAVDERYIVNGLQRARPGLPVSPTTGD